MTEQTDALVGRVAIIGMAGRFPGAEDVEAFWRNLREGRESITRFTPEQLRSSGVPDDVWGEPEYVAAAGVLDDVAGLDIELFQMSQAEAALTDPQHRLFLECAWLALEDSGAMSPDGERRTGVFAATDFNTYLPSVIAPHLGKVGPARAFHVEMGNDKDFLATRVSYKLDLRGPSMSVQTACSSSLVAVHMAGESLISGVCDLAVAGGCRIHVPQEEGHLHHAGGVAAAEPHCRPFDAGASGTLRGNGVAAVVLKRADEAVRDGDHIYALILGSAINNDGAGKVGFTAPSVDGQAAVIREALAVAEVAPSEVGYVEAHGTGTDLGDPIEFAALTEALGEAAPGSPPCVISAVKSNIGHLGSTAGIAGLVKAALAMEHGLVPGIVHFTQPNAQIPLADTRFMMGPQPTPWPRRPDRRRVAGVSSFGIGGTNCHVVLGEAPPPLPRNANEGPELIVLSAASKPALAASAERLARRLDERPPRLADVARTLQVGRRPLSHRWARVANSPVEAAGDLRRLTPPRPVPPAGLVCFLFPGQGSEYAGMAGYTRYRYPAFAKGLDRCADLLAPHGIDLIRFLDSGETSGASRAAVVQPALFAIEYCLADLWMSWGLRPTSVIGHSVGEYVAATLAGVFTLEAGLALTAARGAAMAAMPAGAMIGVRAEEGVVARLLPEQVCIAAVNAPATTVVAGPIGPIEHFEGILESEGIRSVRLKVDHAFHSPAVGLVRDEILASFDGVTFGELRLPIYSNVTGRPLDAHEARSVQYWLKQAVMPVRFMDCVRTAGSAGDVFFLEVGPGNVLRHHTRAILGSDATGRTAVTIGGSVEGERRAVLEGLGAWWQAGGTVDWDRAATTCDGRRTSLPTYPMQRRRCWLGDTRSAGRPTEERPPAPAAIPSARSGIPAGDVNHGVLSIVADVMGVDVDQVDPTEPLVGQGLDSLALLETAERIRVEFGVRLALVDMLGPTGTVAAIVDRLGTEPPARDQLSSRPATATSATPPSQPPDEARVDPVSATDAVEPVPAGAVFAPPSIDSTLTDEQRAFIADFVPRYIKRTAKSRAYAEQSRRPHADPRNSAGFRPALKELVYPIATDRARGASVWDLDGNRYTDMTMGFGAAFFGHTPPMVSEAVARELHRGFAVGPQSALAGVVAERLCRMTGFDRVAFTNSGTEAVMVAIRLARAATRRNRIAIFRGSYHGSYDGVLARARRGGAGSAAPSALGVPASVVSDVVVLDYDSPEALAFVAREGQTLAAVLVEPVQSRRPSLQPIQFLHDLRAATRASGTILLLDEMITGLRADLGGVNALWGLAADLVTYGKVLGGGLPIGAVAGHAPILDLIDGGHWSYGDESCPESELTFFAGTFCKHPLAMAAADAVLAEMQRLGPAVQRDLSGRTRLLASDLQRSLDRCGLPLSIERFSSQMYLDTSAAGDIGELVLKGLLHRGVYVWEGRTLFLSVAHADEDLDHVRQAFRDVIDELAGRRVLPPPEPMQDEITIHLRDEQQLLWLGAELTPRWRAAYNEILTIPVAGHVPEDLVAAAVNRLVARNDALRLRVDLPGYTQTVQSSVHVPLEVVDVGTGEDRWCRGREHVLRLLDTHFDPADGPMVRAALLTSGTAEAVVVLVFPHAVVDGWSVNVLRRDFAALYTSLHYRNRAELRPAPQFAEFVRWEWEKVAVAAPDVTAYWKRHLSGVDRRSLFQPGARCERTYHARFRRAALSNGLPAQLRRLCTRLATTPFVVGLTAWYATLATAQELSDIVVAAALAGQAQRGQRDLVGYCLKVLPLRLDTASASTFSALIERVDRVVRDAMSHWFVSELELINEYWPGHERSRPPMGGVNFELEVVDRAAALPGTTALDLDLAEVTFTKWDISMVLIAQGAESMTAQVVYNPDVVSDPFTAGLLDLYVGTLERGCHNPAAPWASPVAPASVLRPGQRRIVPVLAPRDDMSVETDQ